MPTEEENLHKLKRNLPLSRKDKELLDLYLGGPPEVRQSASLCYQHLHPRAKKTTCQTEGSRILRKPQSKRYLEERAQEVRNQCSVTAQWVLDEAVRLYYRCMGEEVAKIPVRGEKMDPRELLTQEFNATAAKGALELIGKNILVQAFRENIDVTGSVDIAQIMDRRQRIIEDRAVIKTIDKAQLNG